MMNVYCSVKILISVLAILPVGYTSLLNHTKKHHHHNNNSNNGTPPLWNLHVGRKVLHSFAYAGRDVSVWMDKETEHLPLSGQHFYVTPVAELIAESAKCEYRTLTNTYKITYDIKLWDRRLEEESVKQLKFIQFDVNSNQVHPLPFYQIRTIWICDETPINFSLDSSWHTNFQQHYVQTFSATSADNDSCRRVADVITASPYHWAECVNLEYTLSAASVASKVFSVKTDHVIGSSFYANLQSMNTDSPYRFLSAKDLQKFLNDITNQVVASEVTTGEFVNYHDQVSLKQLILHSLDVQKFFVRNISRQAWDDVYWRPEYARPDKISAYLNKHLSVTAANDTVRERDSASSRGGGVLNVWGLFDLNGAGGHDRSTNVETINNWLKRNDYEVDVKGEMFVPKNVELYRLNLFDLRDRQSISTKLVQVHHTETPGSLKVTVGLADDIAEENSYLRQRLTEFEGRLDRLSESLENSSDRIGSNNVRLYEFDSFSGHLAENLDKLATNFGRFEREVGQRFDVAKMTSLENCEMCVVRWKSNWYGSNWKIDSRICDRLNSTKMADLGFYTTSYMQIQLNCTDPFVSF